MALLALRQRLVALHFQSFQVHLHLLQAWLLTFIAMLFSVFLLQSITAQG
jgi:hypothetical protein